MIRLLTWLEAQGIIEPLRFAKGGGHPTEWAIHLEQVPRIPADEEKPQQRRKGRRGFPSVNRPITGTVNRPKTKTVGTSRNRPITGTRTIVNNEYEDDEYESLTRRNGFATPTPIRHNSASA